MSDSIGNGVTPILNSFLFQSYLADPLCANAILPQEPGALIVSSTKTASQLDGFGFTLAPWSQTPVAILPEFADKQGGDGYIILVPGETRRFGSRFRGFKWGLPFGWLGGGDATLFVHRGQTSEVQFQDHSHEILFHRVRLPIINVAPGGVPETGLLPNWPTKFPAKNTIRYDVGAGSTVYQTGRPQLKVHPTKTFLRFRLNAMTAPYRVRALLLGMEDIDATLTGAMASSGGSYEEIVWPITQNFGGGGENQFPTLTLKSGLLVGSGTEDAAVGGIVFIADPSNAETVEEVYIDVLRYGRL